MLLYLAPLRLNPSDISEEESGGSWRRAYRFQCGSDATVLRARQPLQIVIGDSTVEGNGTYNGTHTAKEAGNIRITFDNGTSWMTAKHVFYSAGVITDRDAGASALAASAQEAD